LVLQDGRQSILCNNYCTTGLLHVTVALIYCLYVLKLTNLLNTTPSCMHACQPYACMSRSDSAVCMSIPMPVYPYVCLALCLLALCMLIPMLSSPMQQKPCLVPMSCDDYQLSFHFCIFFQQNQNILNYLQRNHRHLILVSWHHEKISGIKLFSVALHPVLLLLNTIMNMDKRDRITFRIWRIIKNLRSMRQYVSQYCCH
jgi:hypothetical protein